MSDSVVLRMGIEDGFLHLFASSRKKVRLRMKRAPHHKRSFHALLSLDPVDSQNIT